LAAIFTGLGGGLSKDIKLGTCFLVLSSIGSRQSSGRRWASSTAYRLHASGPDDLHPSESILPSVSPTCDLFLNPNLGQSRISRILSLFFLNLESQILEFPVFHPVMCAPSPFPLSSVLRPPAFISHAIVAYHKVIRDSTLSFAEYSRHGSVRPGGVRDHQPSVLGRTRNRVVDH